MGLGRRVQLTRSVEVHPGKLLPYMKYRPSSICKISGSPMETPTVEHNPSRSPPTRAKIEIPHLVLEISFIVNTERRLDFFPHSSVSGHAIQDARNFSALPLRVEASQFCQSPVRGVRPQAVYWQNHVRRGKNATPCFLIMESPMNSAIALALRSTLLGMALSLAIAAPAWAADPGKIVVQVDKPGARISPMLFGLMTEEINYSYDGGLYGELIQNRILKNGGGGGRGGRGRSPPQPANSTPVQGAAHWSVVTTADAAGTGATDTDDPVNTTALATSLKLTISNVPAGGRVGVANDGYWGIPAKPNTAYQCSFYAKASTASPAP